MTARILHGDCLQVMANLALIGEQVDAIVTDPPYEIGMMGKSWDSTGIANNVEMWKRAYDLLKPGGHLLAFSSTRTYHRMVCAIEDAGFEIRDQIGWMYGTGFPKSLDVSKAIDKAAGAEREVIGTRKKNTAVGSNDVMRENGKATGCANFAACSGDARIKYETIDIAVTAPATPAAQQWSGWGTALKPAWEPICVARKPLIGTVADNVLTHGTGALNIDACRVNPGEHVPGGGGLKGGAASRHEGWQRPAHLTNEATQPHTAGRWPANVIHDGSDEVLDAFAAFGSKRSAGQHPSDSVARDGVTSLQPTQGALYADSGTAARFFYSAKASKADRMGTSHPTTKPIALIEYLVKLITPPGGTVLDMFAGSGTLAVAAHRLGVDAILIEREAEYIAMIQSRLDQLKEEEAEAFLAELVS